ncbi:membrane protein [Bradyrhizobium sp. CCBAU 11434]|uniref:OpgC domain-containing protein n=1 Tax=Bradyrhizobium TaxID=374 RepID=UPI002304D48D|nr:OpgC domain-containing protein [Bradyrhizobium sp. CCBAU 11434]MDA9524506.1 membrane protein [Bradyrhizobium sp. CCBAU 11434]
MPLRPADDRDFRLDACRGLALWFVFIDHIPGNVFDWLTLRNYGFSDASEVFVFVSGYTCMVSYGGALRSQGWPTVIARSLRRSFEIYAAFLLLVIVYLGLAWLTSSYLDETNTRRFFDNPGTALLRLLALQYAPVNTDILPTFVLLHLAFPIVLWLIARNAAIALAASFMLYLMVQLYSWHWPAWPTGELYFNPFAWQILFVIGACSAGPCAEKFATILQRRVTISLAAAYVLFSLVIALSWRLDAFKWLIPQMIEDWLYPIYKSHLDPVRIIHFLAIVALLTRIVPPDGRRSPGLWTTALIRCGENSLPIFCFSVLASFMTFVILNRVSDGLPMQAAVTALGIALMVAVANILTWEAKLDRRAPALF